MLGFVRRLLPKRVFRYRASSRQNPTVVCQSSYFTKYKLIPVLHHLLNNRRVFSAPVCAIVLQIELYWQHHKFTNRLAFCSSPASVMNKAEVFITQISCSLAHHIFVRQIIIMFEKNWCDSIFLCVGKISCPALHREMYCCTCECVCFRLALSGARFRWEGVREP